MFKIIILIFCTLCFFNNTWATTEKCTDEKGKISYQDFPCSERKLFASPSKENEQVLDALAEANEGKYLGSSGISGVPIDSGSTERRGSGGLGSHRVGGTNPQGKGSHYEGGSGRRSSH